MAEEVEDGGMDGRELLHTDRRSEPSHGALSPSAMQLRMVDLVVFTDAFRLER